MNSKQVNLVVGGIFLLFSLFLIIFLNFSIIRFLFEGQFNQNLASIEVSYIQMAKFWVEGGGLWQPLWYLGYPWHVFYTPVLPFLEVTLNQIAGFEFGQAYRLITGSAYILVPVSLYFFVWQITKSKTGALVAALFYSFVPTIIGYFFPSVALDTLSGGIEPRRFTILVRWGEGPHMLGLVFLPLFGLFLSKYFEKFNFLHLLGACIFLGLIFLTNALVVWGAILLFIALLLAEFGKLEADVIKLIKGGLQLGVFTLGLVSFWYNLPFITTFFAEGGGAFSNWSELFPWGTLALIIVVAVVFLAVGKSTSKITGGAFAIFWFLMLFSFVFTYYASGENRTEFVPQALRLNTEVDMALAIVAGVIVSNIFLLFNRFSGKLRSLALLLSGIVVAVPIIALLFLGLDQGRRLPEFTKPLSQGPLETIENSAEYRVSKKVASLVGETDQRVFVPGNYSFWINYFVPVKQLRGALFQASTHFWPDHIYFQLTNGVDANISLAWLKISNVGKFVYTTFASGEPYKDFDVGEGKFSSVLTEIERDKGDIYFDVPLKNDRLAKIIDFEAIRAIRKPANAIDEQPIFAYVNEIERYSDKLLEVTTISNNHLRIEGSLGEGEDILVQNTFDRGWRVKQGGWKLNRDPFDFMVITSRTTGEFEIDLVYGKPFSVYLGYLISLGTIGWLFYRFWKSKTLKTALR